MFCNLLFLNLLIVSSHAQQLTIHQDKAEGTITVFKNGNEAILTHHARTGFRPYIHPIVAPDGKGVLTEYRPDHHKHQTGLYWGFTVMNERDYFRNLEATHWQHVSASVLSTDENQVAWQAVYNLLDEQGKPVLQETYNWSMKIEQGKYILDLEWHGKAKTKVTVGSYYAGGLFLRMPWSPGIPGEAINSVGQRNGEAEAQRATWVDVGIQVDGRDDFAHIALFDHPENKDFPLPWRVDRELGVGPCRAILGDWEIAEGETEVIRHRLLVYTGALDVNMLNHEWDIYAN